MRIALVSIAALLLTVAGGCQSTHEKGVTSNYRSQWTNVRADVKTTTEAAATRPAFSSTRPTGKLQN